MGLTGLGSLRSVFATVVLLSLAGCEPRLPSGELETVAPSWGYNGEETPIVIEGVNLLPVVIAANDGARPG